MLLTQKDFVQACCRAIYLWEFGDDNVDSTVRLSDKQLLTYFAGGWMDYKNNQAPVTYSKHMIDKLIDNCQLRSSQKGNTKLLQVNSYLNNSLVLNKYNFSFAVKSRLRDRWSRAREFNEELAGELNEARGAGRIVKGAGEQRALASRVLFFAMPELHVYNYSSPLLENLEKYGTYTGSNLNDVYAVMNDLLKQHIKELKKLPRPKFSSKHGLAKAIKLGDWWERRVLDLAILQNWECFCKS